MTDRRAALGIALSLALAAACRHPEQSVVDQYFTALNAKDNQTLSSFAVVRLDTQDRRVDRWTIPQAGTEESVPAPLVELVKKMKDAEAAVAANKKEYNAYFLEHPKDVDEVRDLLKKPGAAVPPRLQPYATRWKEFTDKEKDLKRALAEAKDAVEKEKRIVAMSLGTGDDLESLSGNMLTKTIDVTLSIAGESKDYALTLRRYDMTGAQQRLMSRWVIYDIKPKA